MAWVSVLSEILGKPRIVDVVFELMVFITPLWIAIIVGVLVGWSWKPKWVNLGIGRDINLSDSSSVSNDSKASSTSFSFLGSMPSFNSFNFQIANSLFTTSFDGKIQKEDSSSSNSDSSLLELEEKSELLTENDLEYIYKLVEEKDGGPTWIQMMDRSTSTMSYQAWRRDPETGPPQYRSRTVYENATPEMLRDFFWDDDFRLKWEDMLISATTLAECPTTGTMVVHWVRKFPFFCSDREYIIGRRIWEAGRSYYCVTKSVPCSSVPRRTKPRRVDLYYSSWCIRAVESKNGGEQLTACEVTLFHYEDMGIPWEIAKLGVRQGMWGAVKRIDPGLRAYQKERALGATLSRCAFMAQINTKVNVDYLRRLENSTRNSPEDENSSSPEKPAGKNIPKLLVVGGAIVLACSIDRGLLTKAVIFGIARRFAKIGRRL